MNKNLWIGVLLVSLLSLTCFNGLSAVFAAPTTDKPIIPPNFDFSQTPVLALYSPGIPLGSIEDLKKQKEQLIAEQNNFSQGELLQKLYDNCKGFQETKLGKTLFEKTALTTAGSGEVSFASIETLFNQYKTALDSDTTAAVFVDIWDYPGDDHNLSPYGEYTYWSFSSCITSIGYTDYAILLNNDASGYNIEQTISSFCDTYDHVDVFMVGHGWDGLGWFVTPEAMSAGWPLFCFSPSELHYYHNFDTLRMGCFLFCQGSVFEPMFDDFNQATGKSAFISSDGNVLNSYWSALAMYFCYDWFSYQYDSYTSYTYAYTNAYGSRGDYDVADYYDYGGALYWNWALN